MTYILFILATFSAGYGSYQLPTVQEFNSLQQCEYAAKVISQQSNGGIKAYCIKK